MKLKDLKELKAQDLYDWPCCLVKAYFLNHMLMHTWDEEILLRNVKMKGKRD